MSERDPGWYRDPDQPSVHRFWDGTTWASTAANPAPAASDTPDRTDPPARTAPVP